MRRLAPDAAFRAQVAALLSGIHTSVPAVVRSYDRATQTAVCSPASRKPMRSAQDEDVDVYEELPDVRGPVLWPRGGAKYVHTGLSVGDGVAIIFSESDFAGYRASGQPSDPQDNRTFSISHGMILPGMFARSRALAGLSDDLEFGNGAMRMRLGASALGIDCAPTSIPPLSKQVALADQLNLFIQLFSTALGATPGPITGTLVASAITTALGGMAAAVPVGPGNFGTPKLKVGV